MTRGREHPAARWQVLARKLRAALLCFGLVGCLWAHGSLGSTQGAARVVRRALVVGVASYPAHPALPEMPHLAASARAIATQLRALPAGGYAEVRELHGHVARTAFLGALDALAERTHAGEMLLLCLVGSSAGDALLLSDGRVEGSVLRSSVARVRGHVACLLDLVPAGERSLLEVGPRVAVLRASGGEALACSGFDVRKDEATAFFSLASLGWARCLEASAAGRPASVGGTSLRDLQRAGDAAVAPAVAQGRARLHRLQRRLAWPVLQAVLPDAADRLERGGTVDLHALRRASTAERWAYLTAVLSSLRQPRLLEAPEGEVSQLLLEVRRLRGREALHKVHELLLRRGLIRSPRAGEARAWETLERDGEVCLRAPLPGQSRLDGPGALLLDGPALHQRGFTTGTIRGHAHEEPRLTIELLLSGASASGSWEGPYKGGWLVGQWSGTWDAAAGRLRGRICSVWRRPGREEPMVADVAARIDAAGHLAGHWQGALRGVPDVGHFTLQL